MSYNSFQSVKGLIAAVGTMPFKALQGGRGSWAVLEVMFPLTISSLAPACGLGRWKRSWRWAALCRPLCAERGRLLRLP